jgi:myo-inositol-1-phosphate synthase
MGLTPKVIASSNHLGNNDMHNLATGKKASDAKLRVKHNIFAGAYEKAIFAVSSVQMYSAILAKCP